MDCIFFFKHKTAYEMRISDWSSDVCSSDLDLAQHVGRGRIVQKMSCLQPGEVHRASDTHYCRACFGRKAETPIGAGDPVAQFQMVFLALHDAATADQARRTERA